jgi:hypothetical protein
MLDTSAEPPAAKALWLVVSFRHATKDAPSVFLEISTPVLENCLTALAKTRLESMMTIVDGRNEDQKS